MAKSVPRPVEPRGFGMMTAYPFAAKSCASKLNSFAYCDCGPPCGRSSAGGFDPASAGSSGWPMKPWISVPSALLNFISSTRASRNSLMNASVCFVRSRRLLFSAAKISYGRSGVLARTMILPSRLTSYAVTLRRPLVTGSSAPPFKGTRARCSVPSSSTTTKTDLPSGDQCGWTTLRSSFSVSTFAWPPAAGMTASEWTAYSIFFGSPPWM